MLKPETFGQYLTAALQQKGYSERHLATLVGVANSTIVRIKKGSIPEPDLFISIIDALDLDVITAVKLVEPYRRLHDRIIAAAEEE
jgi:transcriptional regulator with XRE-family HTH domain